MSVTDNAREIAETADGPTIPAFTSQRPGLPAVFCC